MQPDVPGASRLELRMRDLGYDQGSPPPDHQEQHDSNDDVDSAIEPVRNAPVGEEAEQVDVPLVCVRKGQ